MSESHPNPNQEFYQGKEALVSPLQQRYMDTIATRANHVGLGNYGQVVYGVYESLRDSELLPQSFKTVTYKMQFTDDVYRGDRRRGAEFGIKLRDEDGKNYLSLRGSLVPKQEDKSTPSAKSQKFRWEDVEHGVFRYDKLFDGEMPDYENDEPTNDFLSKYVIRPSINFRGFKDHESEILVVGRILDTLDEMHTKGNLVPSEEDIDPKEL